MDVKVGQCLIRHILAKRKMTPTDLSYKTGIPLNQLSGYLNDNRGMNLTTAKKIAVALQCSIDDLYLWHIN